MWFPDNDEPSLIFRLESWLKSGMLEIEINLTSWALPLSISFNFDSKYVCLKLLCLSVSFGVWQVPYDSLFVKDTENAS